MLPLLWRPLTLLLFALVDTADLKRLKRRGAASITAATKLLHNILRQVHVRLV